MPEPIFLSSLPGGTVGASYNQTIIASGGTGDKSLVVTGVSGSIPGLPIPTGGTNSLTVSGTPTAAGTVSFTVQATDGTGLRFSQTYALTVSTADPSRSTVVITPSGIAAGATATVKLTAISTTGSPETTGGLSVTFGLGDGSASGTFGPVTDNGDATYSAVFTGTIAGNNTITAAINGQPVTTQAPTVAITPGPVDLTRSTISASAAALPVGGTTTVTLTARDADGNQESTGGLSVRFGVTSAVGTFGPVTDEGDGTYTATFTAWSPGSATFTAEISGQPVASPTTDIVIVPLSLALSTVMATPSTTGPDSTALVTFTARDSDGSQETTGGWTVAFSLGSGTGTGTFGPVTDHGRGTYSATFTAGANGTNTISATVDGFAITTTAQITATVSGYVQVTSNPTSQLACAGNPVTFAAAAAGSPTPTVQWQVSTDGGTTFTDLAGATSTTLTFTAGTSQDDDEYRAVFTNSAGSATTAPATLTVSTQPSSVVVSATTGVFPQFALQPPTDATSYFGAQVVTLSTGNFVVTSDAPPAAYLYNGQTGALISALTGTGVLGFGVTPLTNGNYVLTNWSQGQATVTWASGTTGISGTVSAANSLVAGPGVSSNGFTVIPLANGNYVVDFQGWNGGMGAVTLGNGTTGTAGVVSAANSLVGNNFGDYVGGYPEQTGVTALPNGNYVVVSPNWNNDEGATTWASGTTGITGTISAANSLVAGGTTNSYPDLAVTLLTNGNYVVSNDNWDGSEGAVTWGSGTAGITGAISATNSLLGSAEYDRVGELVIPLTNGNYVVDSFDWGPGGAGAVTWGDGTEGVVGSISAANSLIGNTHDLVGGGPTGDGVNGVTALANGNYVVDSPWWSNHEGAVSWGNGATGSDGTVSAANSLVGSGPDDEVGSNGVTALTNGNYVVASPLWDGQDGAATWGNGTTGTIGTVSAANSVVGSHPYSSQTNFSDSVSSGGVTALTNGNYVVDSPQWFGSTGAVTWGNGMIGTDGTVSANNSLVGSYSSDNVGGGGKGVVALTNGNYVVDSPDWKIDEGAVTWGNGTTGVIGTVSDANSLVGSLSDDSVGIGSYGITALPNGNYVMISVMWNQGAGAVTWGNGITGTAGTISGSNSVIDLPGLDGGTAAYGLTSFPDGNYVFWDATGTEVGNPVSVATWFDGGTGATMDGQDTPDPQNSLYGSGGGIGITPIAAGRSFLFTSAGDGGVTVGFTDPNQLTYGFGEGQAIDVTPGFLTRDLDAGANVSIQSNDDITIDSPITETPSGTRGSLTLEAGRSILTNAGINTAGGNLSLIANDSVADGVVNSERDPGDADITMTSGASLNTGSGSLVVDLEQSTDKTNNGRGSVTLLGVDASAYTLPAGSTLDVSINGTTPGDGIAAGTYSQLDVSGSIDLNSATLQVITGQTFAVGTSFAIVESGAGVSGTFNGLPEGSSVVASNGSEFSISYQADGGKAVVLTALATNSTPPPAVTGVSPMAGPTTGGTLVTITGANLAGATAVDFGTTAVTSFLTDTADQITLSSPPGLGTVDITVVTPAGTSATSSAYLFSYASVSTPPSVMGVAPTTGPATGGTTVTISGTNLAGALAVDFGAAKVTSFISDSATRIMVSSPAGSGTVDITVVTPSGTSATSSAYQFTYVSSQSLPTNLSAVSGSGTSGGIATLTSTLTASGVPLAGRTVTFTLSEGGTVSTVGTATTDADGVATLTGVSLTGLNAGTYSGAVGASFSGDSTYAGGGASGTLVVNATTILQSPPVIIGEQSLFRRKTNKKGRPIGKPFLTGFVFDFSEALNPSSATSNTNYLVDTIATKRVKKQTRRIVHPIMGFSVAYSLANDSVTLTFAGKQTFRTGGQITVVGGPPAGVTGLSGAALAGRTVFTISPGGRNIVAQ